ncbi:hypothetical protein Pmar_PMAR017069 [Perkinsus marinus ATCC 50983]|uniref:THH1/TOM1/TOM3 domain-containing protein n=1 Tax=Perkinsus marinus (strain ATCC 50983 / TXsc) TaxID=423536 RepID=C5LSH0_PERM5|nr:hypothetical protein Pmar_PMAR017069 [Perkinsus marinus ATCC 50983]EER00211.1 hypothetical protein Pmar_PMAR017069 [Perkinsus marinus ATCC 50983]|eukprot:XP_002767493.1 hypothetical protein Pmar_PMAR017069 [Perkinsus marinus ATCC 50983]
MDAPPTVQPGDVSSSYKDLPLFTPHSAKASWLAYGDCALFMVIVIVTARQLIQQKREERRGGDAAPAVSLTGSRTRKLFLIGLCLSNLARAVSMIIDAVVHTEVREHVWEHSVQGWTNYFLMVFPSLLFLSTYSIVILFWAQVYYAAILVSYPLLRPVCLFFNIAVYNSQPIYDSPIAPQIQVSSQLKDRSRRQRSVVGVSTTEASKNRAVLNRVLVLTVTCPIIFLVRGVLSLLYGVGFMRTYGPASVDRLAWDSLVYCITEWIPSLLIVIVFWPATRPSNRAGGDGQRSDYGDQSSSYDSLVSPLLGSHQGESNQDIEANRKQARTEQEDARYNDALKKVVPKLPHANPVGPTKPVTDVPPPGGSEQTKATNGRKGRSWSHQLRDVWTGHKEQPGARKGKK